MIVFLSVSFVLNTVTIIINLTNRKMKVYKAVSLISAILLALGISACLAGIYYLSYGADAVNQLASVNTKKSVIGLYRAPDEQTESVSGETRFLALSGMEDGSLAKTVSMLEEELGTAVKVEQFNSMDSLLKVLEEDEDSAALINIAYVDIYKDIEGYGDIDEKISRTAQYEVTDILRNSGENVQDSASADQPFLMYISGIDIWGDITQVSRSDVNILMAVNPRTKQILLVNTPRDYYVTLSGTQGAKDKLTHTGIFGVDISEETMEILYGVDIDYYFKLNFSGFEGLIDALGGITVWSDHDFTVEPVKHFVKGENQLTGIEALAFARERHSFEGGDRQRGINQMNVIQSVIDKLTSSALLKNYQEVMDQIKGTFATDMSAGKIAELVRYQLDNTGSWDIQQFRVNGYDDMQRTYTGGNMQLYVMQPDYGTVEHASQLIEEVLKGTANKGVSAD